MMERVIGRVVRVGSVRNRVRRWLLPLILGGCAVLAGSNAQALSFNWPVLGQDVDINSNTSLTFGAAWRMQDQATDLVGKSNLNPNVCGRSPDGTLLYQSCQGVFRTQSFPAEQLVNAPGQFSNNADDGNLNYDRHDLISAPAKITQDLGLTWGDFGLFIKGLYFYDFVNADFTEYHPNRVTLENRDRVGNISTPGDELLPLPVPIPVSTVRSDSRPCPADRNPSGGPCGIVYGPGGVVRNKRTDKETLRQVGEDLKLLDAFIYGKVDLPYERDLVFKIGRQALVWGEATVLLFDSINQVNPVNANALFRVGTALEDLYEPVGMVYLASDPFDGATVEAIYQYEWQPLEAPAPGSFFSPADIGTNNAGHFLNLGFGQGPEDPDQQALLLDNPLSGVTNTSGAVTRLPDREPSDGGQYGLAFKYYADWLNDGTQLNLYFMNYHARSPFVSFQSPPKSCAAGARNTVEFITQCPDIPLLHALLVQTNDPEGATSDATNFDQLKFMLDYPEDIQMYGFSFNTTLGSVALQGEIVYRPDAPLQVDAEDLAFAAYNSLGLLCGDPDAGCSGSGRVNIAGLFPPEIVALLPADLLALTSLGMHADGNIGEYPPSDFVVDAQGTPGSFNDTYDLIIGHVPGSSRAFPSFVVPYRGLEYGKVPENSYIRGWEYFETFQFNLGGTYVADGSNLATKLIFADQIILLFEGGAYWVPDLPPLDVLQLEAPGTFLHASAGADGSGSDRSRQACALNPACSYGVDGLRFNPHQENLDLYPDKVSFGYAIVAQMKYESVLPGISLAPLILFKHDVHGTSPGLASNFIEGRILADAQLEIRYRANVSLNFGYNWFTGGGGANLIRDRDSARVFLKYQF